MRAIFPAAAAMLLLGGAAARADDTSPPVISHAPVSRGEKGKQTPLFAKVTDESKIFPQVFFRFGPASAYERPMDMKPLKRQRNQWGANLPPPPGNVIEYYIEAYDEFGNGPARAGDPDRPFRIDFGPVETVQAPPLPSAAAVAAAPAAVQPSRGRQWTWLVGGLGVGLLTGGIVANPLGSPRATALDIAGGTLIAASAVLYFVEAPKAPPPPPGGSRRLQVGIAPLPEGGALALSGRF